MESVKKSYEELVRENEILRIKLEEAQETVEAIRTGQVDALIVHGDNGHELYTLKTADQTYRVFIEKMTEGAVTLSRDGLILYCNSRFATMVNSPLSKVMGISFENFISEACKKDFRNLIKKGWEEDCKGETMLESTNGLTPVLLSITTMELDEGFSMSIILTDLTLQKNTQKQLEAQNEQLEQINHALELSNHDLQQFASVASHDLQEPLRKIHIFSTLIESKNSDTLSDDSRLFLRKIIDSANRMKVLIVDILDYSKLSAEDNPFEKTDLREIVEELLGDYEIIIEEKEAKISVENLPVAEVNRGQIRQVFQNILSNALKFSQENQKPEIIISAKRISEKSYDAPEDENGMFARISIRDNGIGFDDKYVNSIFTLFERLNSKDKYEGTGIGLAITKKIIEKHNGLVTARSEKGKGAEFIIVLPLSQNH